MLQSTLKNRTIFCSDNLDIMQGIDSNSIDLIYLDPPFNKNKVFTSPIKSSSKGASFKDIFKEEDIKDEWLETIKEDNEKLFDFLNGIKNIGHKSNYCYLCYMAIRLIEIYRILKNTGSCYLHCDPTMSHYLKLLLDIVFGEKNFRNEIIWCYSRPSAPKQKQLSRVHDIIFWYSKGKQWTFVADRIRQKYAKSSISRDGYTANTSKVASGKVKLDSKGKFPESWIYIPPLKGNAKEYVGYPTQKPIALIHRIIQASTNEGDVVLDPFCGCATTCISAEQLDRKWVGIDVSIEAYNLVKTRLKKEIKRNLFDPEKEVSFFTEPPKRTDRNEDITDKKFVYVISNPSYPNEYKVGVAKDWEARLNQFQTSDPNREYKMEFNFETPFFRQIEKHIHNKFENNHEWVKADLKEIVKEIKSYKK